MRLPAVIAAAFTERFQPKRWRVVQKEAFSYTTPLRAFANGMPHGVLQRGVGHCGTPSPSKGKQAIEHRSAVTFLARPTGDQRKGTGWRKRASRVYFWTSHSFPVLPPNSASHNRMPRTRSSLRLERSVATETVENSPSVPEATIRAVCSVLERTHGSPRHGNKANPLDELVYIILSTRTRDASFRATYLQLKRTFRSWNDATEADRSQLERILAPGGLSRLKADQLLRIFAALRMRFGAVTLAPLRTMEDHEAEAFLTSLPGVAAKIAKCVLMYSLARPVLPVDVHVHRLASRLGLRTKKRPDTSQDLIEEAVPLALRYGFHVNAVAHGRTVCTPVKPRCEVCPLTAYCQYYKNSLVLMAHAG